MKNSNDNIITEVLDDGTVYSFDIELSGKLAEHKLQELETMQNIVPMFDYTTAVFNLFIHSIHILTHSGWTINELINEVKDHGCCPGNCDD